MLAGYLYAVLAYVLWGLTPIYWKLFHHVPVPQVVGHRIVWCCVFLGVWLLIRQPQIFKTLKTVPGKSWLYLTLAALCIGSNWGIYVYAVQSGHILDASFGYFINPLLTIFLARVFLHERLNRLQTIAVIFAVLGVAYSAFRVHGIPLLSLALAATFAAYGLCKKLMQMNALFSTWLETIVLVVPGFFLLGGYSTVVELPPIDMTGMIFAGVITGLPLVWFSKATTLIPFSNLGFLQYLSPTIKLMVATLVYHEVFDLDKKIAFSLIWVGLTFFTTDLALKNRTRKQVVS